MRSPANGRVVAVAEFYHATENIERDISRARQRSWALLSAIMLAIFFLLFLLVRRANDTIRRQRNDLRARLHQLQAAFSENERMRARVADAGAATTALNEQLLHRIAADLHDAPAQTLAFALMRLEELASQCACRQHRNGMQSELQTVVTALRSSLEDLRNIAAGLGIPGLSASSLAEVMQRALRDAEREMGRASIRRQPLVVSAWRSCTSACVSWGAVSRGDGAGAGHAHRCHPAVELR
ncbi:MAG: histidine kinase [Rhodocyclaceae bacterium]